MIEITKATHRVSRLTVRAARNRQVVVSLEPTDIITVRPKGCRMRYSITIEDLYWYAVRSYAEAQRRIKKEERKKKKGIS